MNPIEILNAGLSVIPIEPGTKRAAVNWGEYQEHRPAAEQVRAWAAAGFDAYAVIGGEVSGGLEIIDIDDHPGHGAGETLREWLDWRDGAVSDVLTEYDLPLQKTGGGGYQVFYRRQSGHAQGNRKLASGRDAEDETKLVTIIETRGEGGYALAPGSAHPSGGVYTLEEGQWPDVPTIPDDVADALIEAAQALDETPTVESARQRYAARAARERAEQRGGKPDGTSVIDVYNEAHTVEEFLLAHGYTPVGKGRYSRPGKPSSAGVDIHGGLSFRWSTNDPLYKTNAAGRPVAMDAFNVYCLFEHGGDEKAAVKAAAKELGMNRVQSKPRRKKKAGPEVEAMDDPDSLTVFPVDDSGHAQAVYSRVGAFYMSTDAFGWLRWTGTRWDQDSASTSVKIDAEKILRSRSQEFAAKAATTESDASRSQFLALAKQCTPTAARVRNTLYLFEPRVHAPTERFGAPRNLLNCKNGVVNLETGEIRPHNASDKFTWCIDVDYAPDAKSDLWESLLLEWMNDPETVNYAQRAAGYSITGETREECLFYLYGPGRSGKGAFVGAISSVMGQEVARGVKFDIFTDQSRSDPQGFRLAPLHTVRMVTASETRKRTVFNEALIKTLTGRDPVDAAFKNKTGFSYIPKFTIWLANNHPINGDPMDSAYWRRFRVIPFPNSNIGKEDKTLKDKLARPDAKRAILAWVVAGAVQWYEHGLQDPKTIGKNVEEHREKNDYIGMWLADYIEDSEGGFEASQNLYTSFREFAEAQGLRKIPPPKRSD